MVVIVLSIAFARAVGPQSELSGKIVDPNGAAIAHARVLLHWDSAGSAVGLSDNIGIDQDMSVSTDASGRYSMKVPAGFYDIFVSAMAFTPSAAKVRVKTNKRSTYNVTLRLDPLVSRELPN